MRFSPKTLRLPIIWLRYGVAVAIFLCCGVAMGATAVSNVRAGQRAGTKLVEIDYDITGTTGWVSVSMQVSADAGASYAVPAVAFTGDFGSVPAGRNRRVTWNAGADWNGSYSPSMRFKLTASEAPAGMVLIPAGNFQMGNAKTVLTIDPIIARSLRWIFLAVPSQFP